MLFIFKGAGRPWVSPLLAPLTSSPNFLVKVCTGQVSGLGPSIGGDDGVSSSSQVKQATGGAGWERLNLEATVFWPL